MKYEYLIYNVLIFSSVLFSVFVLKRKMQIPICIIIKSILPISLIYILWDIFVVNKFWYFSSNQTIGLSFFALPIEEYLFFFTVSTALVYTWSQTKQILPNTGKISVIDIRYIWVSFWLALFLAFLSMTHKLYYTASILVGFCMLQLVFLRRGNLRYLNQIRYWVFIMIVMILTVGFDGYLVMRGIVIYDNFFKLNYTIFNVPLEDFLYIYIFVTAIIVEIENRVNSKD